VREFVGWRCSYVDYCNYWVCYGRLLDVFFYDDDFCLVYVIVD